MQAGQNISSGGNTDFSKATIGQQQFHNPIPVAVMIVPVREVCADGSERVGVLAVRRAIEPKKGELALPGGYLEYEDWREGALREVREETGLVLGPAESIKTFSVESVEQGKRLLIFGLADTIESKTLASFQSNSEVSELVVLFEPQTLAFSSHTVVLKQYFEQSKSQTAKPLNISHEVFGEGVCGCR